METIKLTFWIKQNMIRTEWVIYHLALHNRLSQSLGNTRHTYWSIKFKVSGAQIDQSGVVIRLPTNTNSTLNDPALGNDPNLSTLTLKIPGTQQSSRKCLTTRSRFEAQYWRGLYAQRKLKAEKCVAVWSQCCVCCRKVSRVGTNKLVCEIKR